MKLSYDAQISWNNIFSVSSHWISLTIYFFLWLLYIFFTKHFNLHEERCIPHFSKYCKSYSCYTNKWCYIHNVRSSRPEFSIIQLFRTSLEIPAEIPLTEFFVFSYSVNELVCELRPLIDNFAKRFHHRYLKESQICLCNLYLFCLLLISPSVTI